MHPFTEREFCGRHLIIALAFFSLCISFSPLFVVAAIAGSPLPNILWITSEDTGPELGCYGDPEASTPNIDAFAARSLRFERCWSNAPVCAAARTTLIAGMYATSLGAEHMRSAVMTPSDMQLYPQVLQNLGYYCTNNNKTDYNFVDDSAGWDESSRKAHWRNRGSQSQPFFAIFNFTTSHESQINKRPHKLVHDPDRVRVRAYHPDTP
jgi:arylsulfatase A-like enzyme